MAFYVLLVTVPLLSYQTSSWLSPVALFMSEEKTKNFTLCLLRSHHLPLRLLPNKEQITEIMRNSQHAKEHHPLDQFHFLRAIYIFSLLLLPSLMSSSFLRHLFPTFNHYYSASTIFWKVNHFAPFFLSAVEKEKRMMMHLVGWMVLLVLWCGMRLHKEKINLYS